MLQNLHRFDSRFRFSTWLFTIAKRLYLNYSQKLAPVYDSETVEVRSINGPGPGGQTAQTETMVNARSLIDKALSSLPPKQREIVLLFHQQCWPIAVIAEHLHLPQGTVKSHLHRGRNRMKRFIEANQVLHDQVQEVWT